MSLSVDIVHRLGDFTLDAQFEAPGGVTVLFGRSGSGKTSIVNAVAGLVRPDRGRIAVGDTVLFDAATNMPVHKRGVGYIFQDHRLFPHLTVRQNLGYGRRFRRAPWSDDLIDLLGLGALLDRRPAALSGGEKGRVAIGRALMAAPRIVLADEPLAALDEARKAELLPYFERLRDATRVPILFVSHSPAEVARLATTVVAVEAGRVTAIGPAARVLGDPAVTPVGGAEAGAVISARIRAHADDGLTELDAGGVPLALPRVDSPIGAEVRLRIPASEVILSLDRPSGLSALNILPGTVDQVRTGEGPGAIVSVATPAGRILARVTQRSVAALGLAPGTPCHAVVKSVAIARGNVGG